jgi:glycosyltransferase involved in cell wall biosynthesis
VRLTVLSPVGVIGGAERVLLAAVRQLRKLRPGWEISAVLAGDGPLAPALAALGAAVVVVPLPPILAATGDTRLRGSGVVNLFRGSWQAAAGVPGGWEFVRRARAAVRRMRPGVVHSNGLKTHLLAAAIRPRSAAVVWHIHDFYSHRPLAGKLLRRLRADIAVAISDSVRRDTERVLPGLPVRLVRNAVDTGHFAPAGRDPAELDHLAGLPPASVVRVGLVATYANWKGHLVFLDALARVPEVRGFIIGGPIYATAGSQVTRAEMEARVERLGLRGRVGYVPFQPDPADVYRMLDVVVHASTRPEPFGLTIAEAMACGRAVVAARAGGAAELFEPGVDGLAHEPGDAAGLADTIRRLSSDPLFREKLGANARAGALERFREDRFGREMVAVYESVHAATQET